MSRALLTRDQLQLLLSRSNGHCERCGRFLMDPDDVELLGRGDWWTVQHRRPAGMGGTKSPAFNLPENVVLLCGNGTMGCHGWVEINRAVARDVEGWLVWQSQDPKLVPVLLHGERKVLLTTEWAYEEYVDAA